MIENSLSLFVFFFVFIGCNQQRAIQESEVVYDSTSIEDLSLYDVPIITNLDHFKSHTVENVKIDSVGLEDTEMWLALDLNSNIYTYRVVKDSCTLSSVNVLSTNDIGTFNTIKLSSQTNLNSFKTIYPNSYKYRWISESNTRLTINVESVEGQIEFVFNRKKLSSIVFLL
jgi:hypothetical protein